MNRRQLVSGAASLALLSATRPAGAQDGWPSRPIRFVVTYPPGGTADFVTRFFAQHMSTGLGQNIIVDNRTGGGGSIGWNNVVQSPPDGYTFLVTDNSLATAPALLPDLGFDIRTDMTPVSLLVDYPCVLVVNNDVPARTLAEFVEYAKRQGRDSTFYGSMGSGSSPHLYAELLQDLAGMQMTHVPYRGMGPAFTDLLAGRVSFLIAAPATVIGAIRSGRVRALAIGTPGGRVAALPDVPTVRELGFDFTYSFWYGLLGPKNLPQPIVTRMQEEVRRVIAMPEVKARFDEQGGVLVAGDGAALRQVMEADLNRWGTLIRERGIRIEN